DPVLAVGHLGAGAGEEQPQEVAGLLVAQGCLTDAVVHRLELRRAEHVEAAFLASSDDDAAGEVLAELRGEDDAAFVVELRCVRSQPHRPSPPFVRPTRGAPHFTPLLSTFLRQFLLILGHLSRTVRETPVITRVTGVEEKWRERGGTGARRHEKARMLG